MGNATLANAPRYYKKDRKPKGRPPGGSRKTPRQPVQIHVTWLKLARKQAAKRKQPTLWYLISLILEDAQKDGEELPPSPWDEEFDTT